MNVSIDWNVAALDTDADDSSTCWDMSMDKLGDSFNTVTTAESATSCPDFLQFEPDDDEYDDDADMGDGQVDATCHCQHQRQNDSDSVPSCCCCCVHRPLQKRLRFQESSDTVLPYESRSDMTDDEKSGCFYSKPEIKAMQSRAVRTARARKHFEKIANHNNNNQSDEGDSATATDSNASTSSTSSSSSAAAAAKATAILNDFRGLEHFSVEGARQYRSNVQAAVRAVLTEQCQQWLQGRYDPECLARLYQATSTQSTAEAVRNAQHDEQTALEIHFSS